MRPRNSERAVEWIGDVDAEHCEGALEKIKKMNQKRSSPIRLFIQSDGGVPEIGFFFYHYVRNFVKTEIITFALSEIASAALIIFFVGQQRILSPTARLVFHPTVQEGADKEEFDRSKLLYKTRNLEAIDAEFQEILVKICGGKLTSKHAKKLDRGWNTLTAKEALRLGLATEILKL